MRLYRTAFRDGRLGVTEPVPGRWVPWCVAHGSHGAFSSSWGQWCEKAEIGASTERACRWHPQGAFIPEVEE